MSLNQNVLKRETNKAKGSTNIHMFTRYLYYIKWVLNVSKYIIDGINRSYVTYDFIRGCVIT